METAKDAVNYATESVKGSGHKTSKEANKNVAKDPNAGIGNRASAAKDAMMDKTEEQQHKTKAGAHKEAAKH